MIRSELTSFKIYPNQTCVGRRLVFGLVNKCVPCSTRACYGGMCRVFFPKIYFNTSLVRVPYPFLFGEVKSIFEYDFAFN